MTCVSDRSGMASSFVFLIECQPTRTPTLVIEKMRRERYAPRSERSQRLLDQMELELEELTAARGEDAAKDEAAAPVQVQGFTRRRVERRVFPADLARRRIVHPAPTSCPCF